MEALFQIGKELGALTARVSALESKGKCHCGSQTKEAVVSLLSPAQREILLQLRKAHKEIFSRAQKDSQILVSTSDARTAVQATRNAVIRSCIMEAG